MNGSLHEVLRAYPALESDTRHRLSRDAAAGLQHVHKLGFVHGRIDTRSYLVGENLGGPR